MSKLEIIKARLPDGGLRDFTVKVSQYAPWTLEYLGLDGATRCFKASDLFEALREMHKDLEGAGYQLLCAGARPDVIPSRMSRSMGGGRKAYVVHYGRPACRNEMVDIFDFAEPEVVGTTRQQQEYIHAWIDSLRQRT